jgi:hypothetical protein
MRSGARRFQERAFTLSVGWLFADLLFALAMLFLVSNTLGVPPKPKPTPTPTMVATSLPTPTPNALLLDQQRIRLTLSVNNPGPLSQGDTQEKAALAQAIRAKMMQLGLQDRRAGLEIAYGGAEDDTQIGEAENIAKQTYSVLDGLGSQKFVFCHTLHYDNLYVFGATLNTVVIDIFLFDKSVENCQNLA